MFFPLKIRIYISHANSSPIRNIKGWGQFNFFFIIYIVQISKIDPRHTPIPTPAENIDFLQTPSPEKEFLNPLIAHVIINL